MGCLAGCSAGNLLGLDAGVLTLALGIEPRDAAAMGVEPTVLVTEPGAAKDKEPAVALGIETRDAEA